MEKRILAGLILISISICGHAAGQALCGEQEETVFACAYGKKTAAVCASYTHSGALVYAQYRFGNHHSELAIPDIKRFDKKDIHGESFHGNHGGSEVFSVANAEFVYEVATSWDIHDDRFNGAQISVSKNGQLISHFNCRPLTELGYDDSGLINLIRRNNLTPAQQNTPQ